MPVTILAAHTGDMLGPDPANVIRCWNIGGSFDTISKVLLYVCIAVGWNWTVTAQLSPASKFVPVHVSATTENPLAVVAKSINNNSLPLLVMFIVLVNSGAVISTVPKSKVEGEKLMAGGPDTFTKIALLAAPLVDATTR